LKEKFITFTLKKKENIKKDKIVINKRDLKLEIIKTGTKFYSELEKVQNFNDEKIH